MNYFLSVSDLRLLDKWHDDLEEINRVAFLMLLFENGVDISKPIEKRVCTHRNLQNKVVNCLRYDCTERTDKQWLTSGAASVNAFIDSCRDPSLKAILGGMNTEGLTWNAYKAMVSAAAQREGKIVTEGEVED